VCGTGYPNYGHFLYDGLPAVLMLTSMLDRARLCIVGPPELGPWQREILAALNLLRLYRPLPRPVMFRKIVTSSLIALHVSYPTRFVRPVFDMLRFRFGGQRREGRMLFISRAFDTTRRVLTNRAEVEALFRDKGFEIVNPEHHSVADQVRLFASASMVAGESGAGMANVGFCDPGTKVLEIQPDLFLEGWTRAACMIFGHRWHIFCAGSRPMEDPDPSLPNGARGLTFTADLTALRSAIDAVRLA
jgi:capsular polysaccharide biosynthesis protein